MNNKEMPPTWHLGEKTNEELLFIAQRRLLKQTQRFEWKLKLNRLLGRKSKADTAKYYAEWYALAAIDELIDREVPGEDWDANRTK